MAFENLDSKLLDETWYIAKDLKCFGNMGVKDGKLCMKSPARLEISNSGLEKDLALMTILDMDMPYNVYTIFKDNSIHHIGYNKYINRSINVYSVTQDCTVLEYDTDAASSSLSYWYIKAGVSFKHLFFGRGTMGLMHRIVLCEANAKYELEHLQYNSKLSHSTSHVSLIGNGAEANLKFACIGQSDMKNVIVAKVDHNGEDTSSDVEHICIASDKSQNYFIADIDIRNGSINSKSSTISRSVFTESDSKSRSFSRPTLRIAENKVECSHGSTCSYIDPYHIFYMHTRGISSERAKKMLIRSNLNKTLGSQEMQQCLDTIQF